MSLTALDTIHERQEIGHRIKMARLKRGWTQGELAIRANMTDKTTIYKYEDAKRVPTVINGLRLARALGVTLDELFNTP